ncbi:MAG: hypothetical protein PHV75_07675 [Victivallaceae bacterium]|nr:hypothetical protein [Victivallaceae bacterium]
MNNVIISFVVVSILFIWLFGWLGVVGIVLFLLGAWGYAKSGAKPGPVGRFIERLGFHDDEK